MLLYFSNTYVIVFSNTYVIVFSNTYVIVFFKYLCYCIFQILMLLYFSNTYVIVFSNTYVIVFSNTYVITSFQMRFFYHDNLYTMQLNYLHGYCRPGPVVFYDLLQTMQAVVFYKRHNSSLVGQRQTFSLFR